MTPGVVVDVEEVSVVCEDRKMLLEEMTARLDGVHDRESFFVHNGPAEGRVLEGAGEEVERLVASLRMWFVGRSCFGIWVMTADQKCCDASV